MDQGYIEQYQQQGFCLIEQGLPAHLLKRWQELAEKIETEAIEQHRDGHIHEKVCIVQDKVGPRVLRYDDMFAIDAKLVNETLACPAMLDMTKNLVGRGAVPVQMDIVYKQQHPHPVIKWHQGAQHSREYPYLNIGIYLDDAPCGDGCLRYVPNTQNELQDIGQLSKDHGWEIPGVVEQPAMAGDILVQDMMILHGSQPKRSEGVRRTIYIELRPWQSITSQSAQWAELRKAWMSAVLEYDETGIWPEEWREDYPVVEDKHALFQDIMVKQEPPEPAFWGGMPVQTDDYPVPADMKDW